jgi:hypothetical protein
LNVEYQKTYVISGMAALKEGTQLTGDREESLYANFCQLKGNEV